MLRKIFFISFFTLFCIITYGQNSIPDTLASRIHNLLIAFPQEKIYLHTDKPYYLSGEKIWFRAYLADAATHISVPFSRYIYVELINPLDSVVTRVKIRKDDNDAYYGHIPIPDDVPQGDYTLRAYTTYMRNLDEQYFFTKTLHIGDPQARKMLIETDFFFESDRRVYATFRFSDVESSYPRVPQSVKVSVNEGKAMNVNVERDGRATINFNLAANSRKRVMLLEVTEDKYPYRQFISIPTPDNDFDVNFFPEGGSFMSGTACRVVFKAMKSDGRSTEVSGVVYDQNKKEITQFTTDHSGMGSFILRAEKGQRYYAVCENDKGQSKRFDLPIAVEYGYAISVNQSRGNLYVSVLQPAGAINHTPLYLMVHTRGIIQFVDTWDHEKNIAVLPNSLFPTGVLHLILFNAQLHPVSERLVFINNNDQAFVEYKSDKDNFTPRLLVKNSVTISDHNGLPLAGNFSVSVTSDREVIPDSTTHILTNLLLTSDLRGYIENPAFYFQNTPRSASALDLLMCTQGWRRYDIAELAQGRFSQPVFPIEMGAEISGSVQSVLTEKPLENVEVTAASLKGSYSLGKTDKEGRFWLPIGELAEDTQYIVSIEPKKGMTRLQLVLEPETFPPKTIAAAPPVKVSKDRFAQYADKAELQYSYEGGIRTTQLAAAVVTAERKAPKLSQLYTDPDVSFTNKDLNKFPYKDIIDALAHIPSVMVFGNGYGPYPPLIHIAGEGYNLAGPIPAFFIVDDIPLDVQNLRMINVFDVEQIDVIKSAKAAIFGTRGGGGIISIITKKGSSVGSSSTPSFYLKSLMISGYQPPVEFYAPKYETVTQRNSAKPDLRTTIHWQPVVQTDSLGMASFEFYTADEATSYTVIIEGLAKDGTIIKKFHSLFLP